MAGLENILFFCCLLVYTIQRKTSIHIQNNNKTIMIKRAQAGDT